MKVTDKASKQQFPKKYISNSGDSGLKKEYVYMIYTFIYILY